MRIVAVLFLAILSGCAQRPVEPPPALTPAPICNSKSQCDAMWSQVPAELEMLSGMRLQIVSDLYIQTYGATGFGRMSGSATKVPMPDGSTQIQVTFVCRYSCNNLNFKAVNLFNSDIKMAGKSFEAPSTQPSTTGVSQSISTESRQSKIEALKRQNLSYEEYQKQYKTIMGEK